MFTFSEMLALVESESSFGAYVCHRRPGGSLAISDLVENNNFMSLLYWKSWKRGRKLAVWTYCFVHSTTNLSDQINYNDHSVDMKKIVLKKV